MPQIILPVAVAVIARGVTSAIDPEKKAQRSALKKQEELADQQSAIAKRNLALEEQQQEQNAQILSENQELAKKQLALQAQRSQIETLAFLKERKQSAPSEIRTISTAPQPIRQVDIVTRINSFIEGFL